MKQCPPSISRAPSSPLNNEKDSGISGQNSNDFTFVSEWLQDRLSAQGARVSEETMGFVVFAE